MGSTTSNCTQAQLKPYSDCILAACDGDFKTCYGAGYQSGSYSGACGTFETCAAKCGCNDTACQAKCGAPSSDCETCLINISSCVLGASCTIPSCAFPGVGGQTGSGQGGFTGSGFGGFTGGGLGGFTGVGNHTCADLLACCNAMTGSGKTTCMQEYSAVMASGDASCSIIFSVTCP